MANTSLVGTASSIRSFLRASFAQRRRDLLEVAEHRVAGCFGIAPAQRGHDAPVPFQGTPWSVGGLQ
jgi:hypothetical protein